MYLPEWASRARVREALAARKNRIEIVRALSTGQVTRRELVKWGIFTATGALAPINGLSPFARSAFAAVPTSTPRSPVPDVAPFSQELPRLNLQQPVPLNRIVRGNEVDVRWSDGSEEHDGRRLSYHTNFSANGSYANPRVGAPLGPMEGRPPGEYFAHQRWEEYLPKAGYVMTLAEISSDYHCFHPNIVPQQENKIWSFASRRGDHCSMPPPLIKARYGEPVLFRNYNQLPLDKDDNGDFGSNSQATHNHNGHNASGSDGASNAHFFPGQFYDYHWSTCLARADLMHLAEFNPGHDSASGPDDNGNPTWKVAGDFRELQSTLWFHDHRFFYTAENVYKGHLGMLNYYSGPDRGNEALTDSVNLRLPSGSLLPWGNVDFDVNLIISDAALGSDQDNYQQLYFDIFDTAGFLGDLPLVNFAYKPFMEVLPRKYRFRLLSASMSRWFKLAFVNSSGKAVPVTVIANDGNLLPHPVTVNGPLDVLGTAERFDVVVDFSQFQVGNKIRMVNLALFKLGTGPDKMLSIADALKASNSNIDPAVGPIMEFRVVNKVASVDVPGVTHYASAEDKSRVPAVLTEQIPVVAPIRTRQIEYKGLDTGESALTGACFPDCGDEKEAFPWFVRINGQAVHFMNANRVSIVAKPGEVEHWTLINGSGGSWDHPIHLHFEEGITINRGGKAVPATETLARKDVWRLGQGGKVKIQVRFGEFGGAYVNHCHNTVHEDFAMLFRYDILTDPNNLNNSQVHARIIPTPNPSPQGVTFKTPELLAEGNPFKKTVKINPI